MQIVAAAYIFDLLLFYRTAQNRPGRMEIEESSSCKAVRTLVYFHGAPVITIGGVLLWVLCLIVPVGRRRCRLSVNRFEQALVAIELQVVLTIVECYTAIETRSF